MSSMCLLYKLVLVFLQRKSTFKFILCYLKASLKSTCRYGSRKYASYQILIDFESCMNRVNRNSLTC